MIMLLQMYLLILVLQDITSDMYWHYVIELGFYWGLVFTVCSDHKRKVCLSTRLNQTS